MNEPWEHAGKLVAALIVAVRFVGLVLCAFHQHQPQPDIPIVNAAAVPCGPPPGAPPLLTKPQKYHRINDRPKDGGYA